MLRETQNSVIANGRQLTRTNIAAQVALNGMRQTGMLIGLAFGVLIATIFRAADGFYVVVVLLMLAANLVFVLPVMRAAWKEAEACMQDQNAARGKVLQATLPESVLRAAAEAQFTAEEDYLRSSTHLGRMVRGQGIGGRAYRQMERRALKKFREMFRDEDYSLSNLSPHLWQGLSTLPGAPEV